MEPRYDFCQFFSLGLALSLRSARRRRVPPSPFAAPLYPFISVDFIVIYGMVGYPQGQIQCPHIFSINIARLFCGISGSTGKWEEI